MQLSAKLHSLMSAPLPIISEAVAIGILEGC